MKKFLLPVLAIFLQSCSGNMMSGFTNSNLSNETQENYEEYSKPTSQLNKTRELLDGASINFPTLTATGYAVVSTQPGQNVEQKRLMAIRSARMAAMRELAEQIHGLKVDSNTTVIDLMCKMTLLEVLYRALSEVPEQLELIQLEVILTKQF